MTFRKSKVMEAGNYSSDFLYFEDWDLFNRMLVCGCKADNLKEPLVAMRVSGDFYARRGARSILSTLKHLSVLKLSVAISQNAIISVLIYRMPSSV